MVLKLIPGPGDDDDDNDDDDADDDDDDSSLYRPACWKTKFQTAAASCAGTTLCPYNPEVFLEKIQLSAK